MASSFSHPERFKSIIPTSPCFSPIPYQNFHQVNADQIHHTTNLVDSMETPSFFSGISTVDSQSWVHNVLEHAAGGVDRNSPMINYVEPKRNPQRLKRDKECRQSHGKPEKKRPRPIIENKFAANEQPLTNYVLVRARRGEATDPHSLAERVRRKKISVRMKLLQSLVPGCEQLTGKTLILDEIIRYVLLLKNQVQILVAKITSESCIDLTGLDHNVNTQVPKEVGSSGHEESRSAQVISYMEGVPDPMLHYEEAIAQLFN